MQRVNMNLTSTTLKLESLDAGSAYNATFSFSLYEGDIYFSVKKCFATFF